MTGIPLTSLSLTHVQFHPNDLLGEALAYITLAPLAILVFYASIIVSRREVAAILFLVGQLSSEGLNATLKEYLQVSRPNAHLGTGYGMPSSHSQFMAFFAVQVILYTHYNIRLDHPLVKWLLYLPTVILALLVMYSRIHLGYHSIEQVLVGSSIGIAYSVFWFGLTEYVRSLGLIDWLISLPISQAIYLRDARAIDNVAKWEYEMWKAKVHQKQK
ncbi:hypothetical protein K450DRAFT_251152 [Umbelopsis ramanniana AG]|uniref:Dolichyldiphosphatase n=1 Tax=Umbelopsis ramanniana AG TaxID=1314678 RepID=A0AAD5E6G9_UMBRA|nr:uncharacterized protein K450DRAFT_251152 [Umbelopsis ramanniana AG]KAI8577659.1 hypothetical protein K450DRAFT_251152 [Umbelopsis ramanniana AG]